MLAVALLWALVSDSSESKSSPLQLVPVRQASDLPPRFDTSALAAIGLPPRLEPENVWPFSIQDPKLVKDRNGKSHIQMKFRRRYSLLDAQLLKVVPEKLSYEATRVDPENAERYLEAQRGEADSRYFQELFEDLGSAKISRRPQEGEDPRPLIVVDLPEGTNLETALDHLRENLGSHDLYHPYFAAQDLYEKGKDVKLGRETPTFKKFDEAFSFPANPRHPSESPFEYEILKLGSKTLKVSFKLRSPSIDREAFNYIDQTWFKKANPWLTTDDRLNFRRVQALYDDAFLRKEDKIARAFFKDAGMKIANSRYIGETTDLLSDSYFALQIENETPSEVQEWISKYIESRGWRDNQKIKDLCRESQSICEQALSSRASIPKDIRNEFKNLLNVHASRADHCLAIEVNE